MTPTIPWHGTLPDSTEYELRTLLDENGQVAVYEFAFSRSTAVSRYRVAASLLDAAHFYWSPGTIERLILPACVWRAREPQPTRTR